MSAEYLDGYLDGVVLAQRRWAATSLDVRKALVGKLGERIALGARELAETVPTNLPGALSRTVADTLVAEVLPLIEACRFLEREAGRILATRRLGSAGRPIWLAGLQTEVERAPWGVVLVLAAANYPLLLAGVQTLQALVAGNAVLWKPAPGTEGPARALRALLMACGLDAELLTVLDSSVEAGTRALASGVDHVVLTGSAETGKAVLRQLAETLTPATMELSGCDAVFVLPGADLGRLAQALGFGLRFNGSFTCMAPRRMFLVGMADADGFEARLAAELGQLAAVSLPPKTVALLGELAEDARTQGAAVMRSSESGATLITGATPAMKSMQSDVFAPVLSVMRVKDREEALAVQAVCPYALTASIFGPEDEARTLASRLRVGNVLINDIVAPTADPRIAFGGRGRSGFGVTRGAEGLLAMTTPRTIQVQRGSSKRAYEPTGEAHVEFFSALARALYARGLGARWDGLKRVVRAARLLG